MKIELEIESTENCHEFDIDNIDSNDAAKFTKTMKKLMKNGVHFIMRLMDDDGNYSRSIYFNDAC